MKTNEVIEEIEKQLKEVHELKVKELQLQFKETYRKTTEKYYRERKIYLYEEIEKDLYIHKIWLLKNEYDITICQLEKQFDEDWEELNRSYHNERQLLLERK